MLRAALVFFIIGLVAMIFGFLGVAGLSLEIGRIVLVAFLVLALFSFVIGLAQGRSPPRIP